MLGEEGVDSMEEAMELVMVAMVVTTTIKAEVQALFGAFQHCFNAHVTLSKQH